MLHSRSGTSNFPPPLTACLYHEHVLTLPTGPVCPGSGLLLMLMACQLGACGHSERSSGLIAALRSRHSHVRATDVSKWQLTGLLRALLPAAAGLRMPEIQHAWQQTFRDELHLRSICMCSTLLMCQRPRGQLQVLYYFTTCFASTS